MKKVRRYQLGLLFGVSLGLLVSTFIILKQLQINTIECFLSEDEPCSTTLVEGLTPLLGQSLLGKGWQVSPAYLEEIVPYYALEAVEKHLSGALRLRLAPKRLLYQLSASQAGEARWVNEDGAQLTLSNETASSQAEATSSALPLVVDQTEMGAEERHRLVVALLKALAVLKLEAGEIVIEPAKQVRLRTNNHLNLFLDGNDLESAFSRLEAILSHTIEWREKAISDYQEIDLRWQMPVLRNWR